MVALHECGGPGRQILHIRRRERRCSLDWVDPFQLDTRHHLAQLRPGCFVMVRGLVHQESVVVVERKQGVVGALFGAAPVFIPADVLFVLVRPGVEVRRDLLEALLHARFDFDVSENRGHDLSPGSMLSGHGRCPGRTPQGGWPVSWLIGQRG